MSPTEIEPEEQLTREQRRSRRRRAVRKRTESMKRLTKRELALGRMLYPEDEHVDVARPRVRRDCATSPRPCPFVSCKHHLYLDVAPRTGGVVHNFPDLDVDELVETCALDVADRGGGTLEDVGALMNLTRERVWQIEVRALAVVSRAPVLRELADNERNTTGRRRLPMLVDHVEPAAE